MGLLSYIIALSLLISDCNYGAACDMSVRMLSWEIILSVTFESAKTFRRWDTGLSKDTDLMAWSTHVEQRWVRALDGAGRLSSQLCFQLRIWK